jgi:hypothetical protein
MTSESLIADSTIRESPWNLEQMLARPIFIGTYPWTTTQASHTVLKSLQIPLDVAASAFSTIPFQLFTYWRGDVELEIQVVGTPFHQGVVMATFVPLTTTAFSLSTWGQTKNFAALSVNQSTYLYANANSSVKMVIPYNHPQSYISPRQSNPTELDSLGNLYLTVLNPLAAATSSSTTLNISVFGRLIKSQFKAAIQTNHPTSTILAPFRAQSMSMIVAPFKRALHKMIPENLLHDALDLAFGMFGLDKPTNCSTDAPLKVLGNNYLNAANGVENIDKMALYPEKLALTTAETFATLNDEMLIDDLKVRFSYMGTFSISTTTAIGQSVAVWYNDPMTFNYPPVYGPTKVPLLSYISAPFTYWKGGITYKFQAVCTSVHACKLFIAYNPNIASIVSTEANTTTIDYDYFTNYGAAFEINQGTNEFLFTVPYMHKNPQCYVPTGLKTDLSSTGLVSVVVMNPLVAPNNVPLTIFFNVFVAGASDFALSTLAVTNNWLPIANAASSSLFDIVPVKGYRGQSAPLMIDKTDTYKQDDSYILAKQNDLKPHIDTSEASIVSFRDVLKKYQLCTRIYMSPPGPNAEIYTAPTGANYVIIDVANLVFTTSPVLTAVGSTSAGGSVSGIFNYLSAMYRSYRGGLRFKIIQRGGLDISGSTFSVFYMPPYAANDTGTYDGLDRLQNYINSSIEFNANSTVGTPAVGDPGYHITSNLMSRLTAHYVTGVARTAELEIPFNSVYNSILLSNPAETSVIGLTPLISLGFLVLIQHNNAPAVAESPLNLNYDIYASFSDESRFGNIYSVPQIMQLEQTGLDDHLPVYPDSLYTNASGNLAGIAPL